MSSKSSVPQAASFVSHVLMSDRFYGARGTLPKDNSEVADRIRGIITRLGIRNEIIRRMKLGKLPRYTPPRDGYGGRAQP